MTETQRYQIALGQYGAAIIDTETYDNRPLTLEERLEMLKQCFDCDFKYRMGKYGVVFESDCGEIPTLEDQVRCFNTMAIFRDEFKTEGRE